MRLKSLKVKKNVELAPLTTFKIGGKAKHFFIAESVSGLERLLSKIEGPFYLLGKGSNLLISDREIKKPVIKLSGEFQVVKKKDGFLEVGGSTLLSFLIQYFLKNNLSGIENLAAMPATIGGMLSTHASSFGTSIFDCLEEVEVMNKKGAIQKIKKNDINYGYRYSSLSSKIIIRGFFKFFSENKVKIKKNIQKAVAKRLKHQDFSFPSCGSVFKNPLQITAGKLIEKSGLKGVEKGGLKISQKHANFILNWNRGTYKDADYLIGRIKDLVYQRQGVLLEEEVQRWK